MFLKNPKKERSNFMKSTGIVRAIDELGRICLPKEYRKVLGLESFEEVDMQIENGKITIGKFTGCCSLCGSENKFKMFGEKRICIDCLEKLNNLDLLSTKEGEEN